MPLKRQLRLEYFSMLLQPMRSIRFHNRRRPPRRTCLVTRLLEPNVMRGILAIHTMVGTRTITFGLKTRIHLQVNASGTEVGGLVVPLTLRLQECKTVALIYLGQQIREL